MEPELEPLLPPQRAYPGNLITCVGDHRPPCAAGMLRSLNLDGIGGCNWRFRLGMVVYNVRIVLVQPSDGGERPVGRPTCHLRVALLLGRPIVHMKAGLVGF